MTDYVKFACERGRRFALSTSIEEKDGEKQVRKSPIFKEAAAHVAAMAENAAALDAAFAGTRFKACPVREEGGDAVFPFVAGKSLEADFNEAFALGDEEGCDAVAEYFEELDKIPSAPFEPNADFENVFGSGAELAGLPAVCPADIDLLPDNVIESGGKWTVIDFEWTFGFPVPLSFIKWRVLEYYGQRSGRKDAFIKGGLYDSLGASLRQVSLFTEMEASFQHYIEDGAVPFRNLYDVISPGCIEVSDDGSIRSGGSGRSVICYFDDGEGFTEKSLLRLPVRSDGAVEGSFELMGARQLRIDPTEDACLIADFSLKIDGREAPLDEAVTNGFVADAKNAAFLNDDPQLAFTLPKGAERGELTLKISPVGEAEAERLFPLAAAAAESRKGQLKAEHGKEMLGGLYGQVRGEALRKAQIADDISKNKSVKAVRKTLNLLGKDDFFKHLRPELKDIDAGMHFCVDQVVCEGGVARIWGWHYDSAYSVPEICAAQGETRLKARVSRYVRKDINEVFSLESGLKSGFLVKLPLKQLEGNDIALQFENPWGYIAQPLHLITERKEQEEYLRQNMPPMHVDDAPAYDTYAAWMRRKRKLQPCIVEGLASGTAVVPVSDAFAGEAGLLLSDIADGEVIGMEISAAGSRADLDRETAKTSAAVKKIAIEGAPSSFACFEAGVREAEGDFCMVFTAPGRLEKDAARVALKVLLEEPEADVVYTDEDRVEDGMLMDPCFKPDFDPELLESGPYLGHFMIVRTGLLKSAAAHAAEDADGMGSAAAFYALELRLSEAASKVVHVESALFHASCREEITPKDAEEMAAVLNLYFERTGIAAKAEGAAKGSAQEAEEAAEGGPAQKAAAAAAALTPLKVTPVLPDEPMVSVIIPNNDEPDALRKLLESLFSKCGYGSYEVIVAENNSQLEDTFALYEEMEKAHGNFRVAVYSKDGENPFNYSLVNNYAAGLAKGSLLLFLNNDTEVTDGGFMERMAGYCLRDGAAACGALLLYPDGTVQHAGAAVGIGGAAAHVLQGLPVPTEGGRTAFMKTRCVSAATAACLMVRRGAFEEAGGFDADFAVAYNDIDLCLKLTEKGYRVIEDTGSVLYHYESLSRGLDALDEKKRQRQIAEARLLRERHPGIFRDGDPFFNAHYDLLSADPVLAGTVLDADSPLAKLKAEIEGKEA